MVKTLIIYADHKMYLWLDIIVIIIINILFITCKMGNYEPSRYQVQNIIFNVQRQVYYVGTFLVCAITVLDIVRSLRSIYVHTIYLSSYYAIFFYMIHRETEK